MNKNRWTNHCLKLAVTLFFAGSLICSDKLLAQELSAFSTLRATSNIPDNEKGYSTDRIPERLEMLVESKPVIKEYTHSDPTFIYNMAFHINGLGVFKDESLIFPQERGAGQGNIFFNDNASSNPQRLNFIVDSRMNYQSGVQACGDFVAIATVLYGGGASEVRFYQKRNGQLSPLPHLTKNISGRRIENVGLVYHTFLNRHFMAAQEMLFLSNGLSLTNPNCEFTKIDFEKNWFIFGEAGGSLLYTNPSNIAPFGILYWASCGGHGGDGDIYRIKLNTIALSIRPGANPANINIKDLHVAASGASQSFVLKEAPKTNLSIIDVGTDTRPSFRWGGNLFIDRLGQIKAFASERDMYGNRWNVAVWSPQSGSENSNCACRERTFRNTSAHTWVEFRLPAGTGNQIITIRGGAYNRYVFPKCNRVYWSDLTFKCNPSTCSWDKIAGTWGADALCHGSKGNSPYVVVGDK